MTQKTADEIRLAVSAAYGARAREVAASNAVSCCGPDCCGADAAATATTETAAAEACCETECCGPSEAAGVMGQLYDTAQTAGLPETVVSYGCGNPVAIGALQAGETVLDLGSGAGLDCFLAARQVGASGHVIGVDMTDDMLALAAQNKAKLGAENVEFRKGVMEALPVADADVDVIISNCVINLSPDKDAVFREAFRVLRPGGRLHVSDVVLLHPLSTEDQNDLNLWAGCISGALAQDDYAARLQAAGFTDVAITLKADDASNNPWRSALIDATRPGGAPAQRRTITAGERIELLALPGLQTASCCATDAAGETRCC